MSIKEFSGPASVYLSVMMKPESPIDTQRLHLIVWPDEVSFEISVWFRNSNVGNLVPENALIVSSAERPNFWEHLERTVDSMLSKDDVEEAAVSAEWSPGPFFFEIDTPEKREVFKRMVVENFIIPIRRGEIRSFFAREARNKMLPTPGAVNRLSQDCLQVDTKNVSLKVDYKEGVILLTRNGKEVFSIKTTPESFFFPKDAFYTIQDVLLKETPPWRITKGRPSSPFSSTFVFHDRELFARALKESLRFYNLANGLRRASKKAKAQSQALEHDEAPDMTP